MNNWANIQTFLAVMDCRSLSGAARQLGLSQPTIGRHIDALERSVGEKLFIRSRYGLSPTDAAHNMVAPARAMAAAAAATRRAVRAGDELRGTVRLTASEIVGVEILPSVLAEFSRQHPMIQIELVLTNRSENLLKREADIAIRMLRPVQEALVARKIGDVSIGLYAHQSYVRSHGMPHDLGEIGSHLSIGPESRQYYETYAGSLDTEQLRAALTFKSDSDMAQLALVRAGCGIGGVQRQLAARDPQLIAIMPDQFMIPMEMWLVTHEDMINTRIIRLLFDHLARHLKLYVNQR